jgi:hypothetical protein
MAQIEAGVRPTFDHRTRRDVVHITQYAAYGPAWNLLNSTGQFP